MFERFTPNARSTVRRAQRIAVERGSTATEAEHLLLALTHHCGDRTTRALRALGLSEQRVRAAIDQEYCDALSAVGVAAPDRLRSPARRASANPRWSQSAKLALERTVRVALDRGHRRIDDHHILLALTHAEAGAIPRVLRVLGVTPSDIDVALR